MKTRTITLTKDEIISLLFLIRKGAKVSPPNHPVRRMIGTAVDQLSRAYEELEAEFLKDPGRYKTGCQCGDSFEGLSGVTCPICKAKGAHGPWCDHDTHKHSGENDGG